VPIRGLGLTQVEMNLRGVHLQWNGVSRGAAANGEDASEPADEGGA
jgi:hypothetical protein